MKKRILIVDDEASHRLMLKAHLDEAGFAASEAASGEEALERLQIETPDLMLLDIKMPGISGLEVIEKLREKGGMPPVVLMTAYSSIESALKAGRLGIKHYLSKPLDTDQLIIKINEIFQLKDVEELQSQKEIELNSKFDFKEILGTSPVMLDLKEMLSLVAPSEATVLITGESGTGKELVAKAIHKNSPRKDNPFIAVNCAALTETLLESELFGHEKGAFTGAHQRKAGRFQLAEGGSLFLDEIGEMPLTTQAKLLRVLEERTFEMVGGTKTINADVRVLAATNRDLEEEIRKGTFREDLYYRLNVVQIQVPTLRERGEKDIKRIAESLLVKASERNRKPVKGFSNKAMFAITSNPWPGNVRELVNAIERSVILSRTDEIQLENLPLSVQEWAHGKRTIDSGQGLSAGMTIKEVEAELIQRTLAETQGNKTKAASMLGITRQTLLNKIREYNIE